MILELPEVKTGPQPPEMDWTEFRCLLPRVIEDKLVWLRKAERRVKGYQTHYDGDNKHTMPIWEYRLKGDSYE